PNTSLKKRDLAELKGSTKLFPEKDKEVKEIELYGEFYGKLKYIRNMRVVIKSCNTSLIKRTKYQEVDVISGKWSVNVLAGDYEIEFRRGNTLFELFKCKSYDMDCIFNFSAD